MKAKELQWSTFSVPYGFFKNYFLLMIFALWFLPGVMGIRFTVLGYILNYLWADFMFYMWYKTKMSAKEYWEEQKRKRDWQDRDDDDNTF
ncbi:uncharacterized protein METZ01_LOCUS269814 [marine metagenome]|jgi:predicted membrane protein|uniref:Uncharacterized protein n=1 Tax=marine metagenome TaxID=408172 RepID=A0A382JXU7_9ZZZZ|tara:strand:- start:37765 stop:38034 length:270 start_codon:yes stop_codon:yes gene_type:complete